MPAKAHSALMLLAVIAVASAGTLPVELCAQTSVVSLRVNRSSGATPETLDVAYSIPSPGSPLGTDHVELTTSVTPSAALAYHYSFGSPTFRGVNAFFHIDSMYRRLARTTASVRLPAPVRVNTAAASTLALPGPTVLFGDGANGRHSAEDPGIVAHEAGHAILDANSIFPQGLGAPAHHPQMFAPGDLLEAEASALDEGMATFLAAVYVGSPAIGELAGFYTQRTDRPTSTHRMSQYIAGAIQCQAPRISYCYGEIWASALWDYYQSQGDSALAVILRSLAYWPNNACSFAAAADAIRAAASEAGATQAAAVTSAFALREIGTSTPRARVIGPSAIRHTSSGKYHLAVDGGLPPYAYSWTTRQRVDEETTLSYLGLTGSPTPDSLTATSGVPGGEVLTVIGTVVDQRGASFTDSILVDVIDPWLPPTSGIHIESVDGLFTAQLNELKSFVAPYNSPAGNYNNLPAQWEYRLLGLGGDWLTVGTAKLLQVRSSMSYELRAHRNGDTASPQTVTVAGGPVPVIGAVPSAYSCSTPIELSASASGGVPGYSYFWSALDDESTPVAMSALTGPVSGLLASEFWEYVDVTLVAVDAWGTSGDVTRRIPREAPCSGGGGGDPGEILFASARQVDFVLASAGDVDLRVYDIAGREVAQLVSGRLSAGRHAALIPQDQVRGRVLFVMMRLNGQQIGAKRIVLKE